MCIKNSPNQRHVGICNNFQPFLDGFKVFKLFEIRQSAAAGCTYCSVVLQALGHFVPDLQEASKLELMISPNDLDAIEEVRDLEATSVDSQHVEVYRAPVEITINLNDSSFPLSLEALPTKAHMRMLIYNPSDVENPDIPTLGTMRKYTNRSDSAESFDFVQNMLQTCLTTHTSCIQPSSLAPPKRLLMISGDQIKLVEPSSDDIYLWMSAKKYAALSHCWGSTVPIKLLHETMKQFRMEINWHDLTATFQDGITVARRLGIEWIWIDSLCIIQNDTSDWEIEASKMSDYYQNAHITISATSSANGSVPFLRSRDPLWTPARFESKRMNGKPFIVEARLIPDKPYSNTIDGWGPLITRAWTFQEHVLSTRAVHYTPAEVIWDCIEERNSETGILYINLYESIPPKIKVPGIYVLWYDMVQRYSLRQITFESDRLPALSGIARIIQQGSGSNYVAGLWKEDLVKGLCWSIRSASTNKIVTSDENKVPSWSWASVNVPITFLQEDVASFLVTINHVSCEISGLNPFGNVAGGTITLRGQLAKVIISSSDSSDWINGYHARQQTKQGQKAKAISIAPDGALSEYEFQSPAGKAQKSLSRARTNQQGSFEIQTYGIPIAQCKLNNMVFGLILGQSEISPYAYARLGSFCATRKKLPWLKDSTETNVTIM